VNTQQQETAVFGPCRFSHGYGPFWTSVWAVLGMSNICGPFWFWPVLVYFLSVAFTDEPGGGDTVATADSALPTVDSSPTSSTCPACQSTFDSMSSLVGHVTVSHGRRGTVRRRRPTSSLAGSASQRPFRCHRCWKTFAVESKLRLHMLSHAENLKDFKCEVS